MNDGLQDLNSRCATPEQQTIKFPGLRGDGSRSMETAQPPKTNECCHLGNSFSTRRCDTQTPPTTDESSQENDSLHFQRNRSMCTLTQLISHDTRTSFEHVNQIIKHGSALGHNNHRTISSVKPHPLPPPPIIYRSPSNLPCRKPSRHVVKKVIVIQPGEDPEKVTADAINRITESLNREAAQRIANGRPIDTDIETVIEITRIKTPSTITSHPLSKQIQLTGSPEQRHELSPEEKKHHRRKSPHPKRYMYHTPSPKQDKQKIRSHSLNAGCYFQSKPKCSELNNITASRNLLGLGATQPLYVLKNNSHKPAENQSSLSMVMASGDTNDVIASTPTSQVIIGQPPAATIQQRQPSILRPVKQLPDNKIPVRRLSESSLPLHTTDNKPVPAHSEGVLNRQLSENVLPLAQSVESNNHMILGGGSTNAETDSGEQSIHSSGKLNESLTNIQWLGSMSGDNLDKTRSVAEHRDIRVLASEKQIDMISRECGKKKRPPYSYMHLIQMAICSNEEKRMTLKEIYSWIEEKFPYYKHCPNQGWKNSIRHNLSLYDIFVREKTSTTTKAKSSYWTLRPDIPLRKTKSTPKSTNNRAETPTSSQESQDSFYGSPANVQPIYIMDGSASPSPLSQVAAMATAGRKKGPVPLLPKPSPMQTYALIPIQGGIPMIPPQPIMISPITDLGQNQTELKMRPASATDFIQNSSGDLVQLSGSIAGLSGSETHRPASACDLLAVEEIKREGLTTPPPQDSTIDSSLDSVGKSSLKRYHSPTNFSGGPTKKHVKIAPKIDVYDSKSRTISQHRLKNSAATCTVTRATTQEHSPGGNSMDTTDIQNQMIHLRFADSGFVSDSSGSDQIGGESSRNSSGLPKPTMYFSLKHNDGESSLFLDTPDGDKRATLLSIDTNSDAGLHDILASIEKSLSSPMKNMLRTPPKSPGGKNNYSSLSYKAAFDSPGWLSPIKGLTPIAGDPSLVGDLFTPQKDGKTMTSTPYRTESTPVGKGTGERTPEGSPNNDNVCHYNFPNLTPLKTPFKSPQTKGLNSRDRSPGDVFGSHNHSFSKLLGEFPLDSMIDEGINLDVSNMSFSALQ